MQFWLAIYYLTCHSNERIQRSTNTSMVYGPEFKSPHYFLHPIEVQLIPVSSMQKSPYLLSTFLMYLTYIPQTICYSISCDLYQFLYVLNHTQQGFQLGSGNAFFLQIFALTPPYLLLTYVIAHVCYYPEYYFPGPVKDFLAFQNESNCLQQSVCWTSTSLVTFQSSETLCFFQNNYLTCNFALEIQKCELTVCCQRSLMAHRCHRPVTFRFLNVLSYLTYRNRIHFPSVFCLAGLHLL